jgi:hypothetical protein
MPARSKEGDVVRGLRFKAGPDFWLRRISRVPFYIESHNASFRIDVERVEAAPPDDPWPNNTIEIQIVMPDKDLTPRHFPVPDLAVGARTRLVLTDVFITPPGNVMLRIPINPVRWATLFAYTVREEGAVWAAFLGALLLLAGVGLGSVCQRTSDVNLNLPTTTPISSQSTLDTSMSPSPTP